MRRLLFLGWLCRLSMGDFRTVCSVMTTAKMDPIVMPGVVSGHYHDVVGSLGFDVHTDIGAMLHNDTTCTVNGDFSDYWAPSFYHVDPDTAKSTRLKGFFKTYYGTGRMVKGGLTVQMPDFPRNLSMVTHAASFVCRGGPKKNLKDVYGKSLPEDGFCPFIRIVYQFPSCWNGQQYAPDQSHMTYATGASGVSLGRCPDSHPQHIFFVRLEHNFIIPRKMQQWTGPAPFALSSGGLETAHADATIVWDKAVLTEISRRCASINPDTCDSVLGRIPGMLQSRLRTEAVAKQYRAAPAYTEGSDVAPYVPSQGSPSSSPTAAPTWAPTIFSFEAQ